LEKPVKNAKKTRKSIADADVVVIGASVAGLMACRELHKNNVEFICIDRKKAVGEPLCCGEGLRAETFYKFFGKGNLKDYSFIKNRVSKNVMRINNDSKTIELEYLELSRPDFERWLAKDFKDKISLGEGLQDIKIGKDSAVVLTNKRRINAKIVLLAYGPSYFIQKNLGLISKAPAMIPCYGGIYRNCELRNDEFLFIFSNDYKIGSNGFWAFPKGNGIVNAGMGYMVGGGGRKPDIKSDFEEKIEELPGFSNAKKVRSLAGAYPCDGVIGKTYCNRMLVLGSAAGFVFAATGEGIKYALRSGDIAAKTAIDALKAGRFDSAFLKLYEKRWKIDFGDEIRVGNMLFELAKFALANFTSIGRFLKYIRKGTVERITHGRISLRVRLGYFLIRMFKGRHIKNILDFVMKHF